MKGSFRFPALSSAFQLAFDQASHALQIPIDHFEHVAGRFVSRLLGLDSLYLVDQQRDCIDRTSNIVGYEGEMVVLLDLAQRGLLRRKRLH